MADVKISQLPARSAVATTDILPVVDAAAGTPATQKATVAQVRAAIMPVVLTADVTGTLPSANAPSHTGDVTGPHTATVVGKVNGATVPAAGALTTGNVLQATGAAALGYGPVNLAGGSNYVTGTLPAANQAAAGSSPQFTWNSSGTPAGAAGFTYDLSTTQAHVMANCGILFQNVAATFDGRLFWNVSAAQTVVFPDATGTVDLTDNTATLTNKTLVAASNTITDTSATTGDILRHNGTRFVRLARGSANQVLTTNAGATDIAWATPATSSPPTGTGFYHVTGGSMDAAAVSLTWTGDATGTGTGTSFALTVVKVNGTSYPAGGALTTGTIPRVTGGATVAYGALDLANASAVTGALPLGNMASPTGTGLPHVIAGAMQAAASLLVNADVNAVAAIAGTKISPDFGSQTIATTGHMNIGASPYGVGGLVRAGYSASAQQIVTVSDAGGTNSRTIASSSGDVTTTFGDIALTTIVNGAGTQIHTNSGTSAGIYIDPGYGIVIDSSKAALAVPMVGDTNVPSPYSAHGEVVDATAPPFTAAAATYAYDAIKLTNAGAGNVTFPLPASAAASYYKTIINTGNGTKTITNGGGSTWGLVTNSLVRLLFDTSGVHLVSAVVAYP